jgi:hypothetical protein
VIAQGLGPYLPRCAYQDNCAHGSDHTALIVIAAFVLLFIVVVVAFRVHDRRKSRTSDGSAVADRSRAESRE